MVKLFINLLCTLALTGFVYSVNRTTYKYYFGDACAKKSPELAKIANNIKEPVTDVRMPVFPNYYQLLVVEVIAPEKPSFVDYNVTDVVIGYGVKWARAAWAWEARPSRTLYDYKIVLRGYPKYPG